MAQLIKGFLILILLLCLAPFPYGYYQFVRITSAIGFSILAYNASKKNGKVEVIIYVGLVILFQPLIKIALGRTIWNIVDVAVAAMLAVSIIFDAKTIYKRSSSDK